MLLDLAELDRVFAGRWLWSTSRAAPFRFHRNDHFGDPAEPLTESVRREIFNQTGEAFQGSIRLLTQLRHFGFVFNPVSFYYCFREPAAAEPAFIVAEVNNTPWGQRHCYVLRPGEFARKLTAAEAVPKVFHVSPFLDLDLDYLWHVPPPGPRLSVDIANRRGGKTVFDVTLQLERKPIDTLNLAGLLLAFPLSTFRVFAQIYWQALRLWWKRVPFVPHPAQGQAHGNQNRGRGSTPRLRDRQFKLSAAGEIRELKNAQADPSPAPLATCPESQPPVKLP